MSIRHPSERELQRFLNGSCVETEHKRLSRHMQRCVLCRGKLHGYLELEQTLGRMAPLQAPPRLADRIMRQISLPSEIQAEAESRQREKERPSRPFWRSELANGLIATGATFLFVSTGITGKLMTLNPAALETSVADGIAQWSRLVAALSEQLLF